MLIFIAIAVASFLVVTGAFLLGHDHDVDHDHGDVGHDVDLGGEPTIGVFSPKVLGTLLMGFGAAGAISRHMGFSYVNASLIGVLCGAVLGGLMYAMLSLLYKQQATSLVSVNDAVGRTGAVTVSIAAGAAGEVAITLSGQYNNYSATSNDGQPIAKGQMVRVVKVMGSQLIVEKA